jgi:serralysin
MRGGAGHDVYWVDRTGDLVDEGAPGSGGIDRILSSISFDLRNGSAVHGVVENLTLMGGANLSGTGNAVANTIVGNDGANVLDGLGGNDWLIGGIGRDVFVFDSRLDASFNVDHFQDFNPAQDSIRLSHSAFGQLTGKAVDPSGVLAANAFYAGSAAHDATDRIIYNPASGWLSYDADGDGRAAGLIHFATVGAHLPINHAEFTVV